VRGTRTPVRCIVEMYQQTQDFERTAAMFSHLSRDQVQGALDYYAAYPQRVDEDIERNARAALELLSTQPAGAATPEDLEQLRLALKHGGGWPD
jgi:uncharacterized protein (DUF433 family)